MRETPNLLLKLPDPTDYVLVEDLNENFTKLDTEIAKITDEETGVEAKLTKHLDENIGRAELQNGWVGVVDCILDTHNNVSFNIDINSGVQDVGTVIIILPEGFRPNTPKKIIAQSIAISGDTKVVSLMIGTDGKITLESSALYYIGASIMFKL